MWHKKHTNTVTSIGLIVILMLFGTMVFAQDTVEETATPEPTQTAMPTATATELPSPTPTATELPTQTAVPTELPTETPVPTQTEVDVVALGTITVSNFLPTQFTEGVGGILAINGENFTNNTTVALNGTQSLSISSWSSNSLMVNVDSSITAGTYSIVVSDPTGGTQTANSSLVVNASTSTPTATATTAQITISNTEPSKITEGVSGTLSILGTNFTTDTTVRLVGFGFLDVAYINDGALTATLPATIPTGHYSIQVSDTTSGTATASKTFRVVSVSETSTPIPGQPRLVVNTFSANPTSIYPGDTTTIIVQVSNEGSREAEGVVVALGDTTFAPANGQASVTLPDLSTGESTVATLSVTAPADAVEGTQSIGLTLTSRDFDGMTYIDTASVSVTILSEPSTSAQVVLDSYMIEPESASPGEVVTVQALFANTGRETAEQVLVELDSTSGVLIAGSTGNAYSIGEMPAGAVAPITMSFVVASGTSSGMQSQALTISYLQDEVVTQSTASFSIDIVNSASPTLLLESYSTEEINLQPGQPFTFQMTIQNAGVVDVSDLMVTFGEVTTYSSSSDDSDEITTTSSDDFAIYGSGDTQLLGELAAGNDITITQNFIVNSDLTSGIHTLPITLQYLDNNGTEIQQSFSASLLVVVQPRVRITAASTLDDPLTVGEEYDLSVEVYNLSDSDVELTDMVVTGENVEITDGGEALLDPLESDDDITQAISFTPLAEGEYSIIVEVNYIDDLNQIQTFTEVFIGQVEAAQEAERPMRQMPPTEPVQEDTSTTMGRLLLGFLGFGG